MHLVLGAWFLLVAAGLALVRFRCSPLYGPGNDPNSDVYVYQVVGNSWVQGLLPYRDVYDVKGPFLYLLFGLFARIRPWSMAPPLVALGLLAWCSLWLGYAIARLHRLRRPLATLAACVSCVTIYLSVAQVSTSFTCEELAVPAVLLLLWLVLRWLSERDSVADGWWVLDGLVLGALFWTKYQVIAPWAAMLVALTTIVLRTGLSARSLARVVVLHLVGVAVTTLLILGCFAQVLPDMVQAYFVAKRAHLDLSRELPGQARFAAAIVTHNTAAALALAGVLVLLIVRAVRGPQRDGLALVIAYGLSLWASAAFVRHHNNLFVPLSFCAVAVPQLLLVAQSSGRIAARTRGVAMAALAVAGCVPPLAQGVSAYGLFWQRQPLTCYQLPTLARTTSYAYVSSVFAQTAGQQPILSVGTLTAARTLYISRLPMRHPFEFVDASWSSTAGADAVQARYLQDRTFAYVWIHLSGIDPFHDLEGQIAAATYTEGASQPDQAAALAGNYVPVLACNQEILLRAR